MPRGVKKPVPRQDPLPGTDPYPEHAKMYANRRGNHAINDFLFWMLAEGHIDVDTLDNLHDLHLMHQGVDKLAYEIEVRKMKNEYRWLWDQYHVDDSGLSRTERVVVKAVTPVVQAALPEPKGGRDDGLAFLLARIRGEGRAGQD